MQTDGIMQTLKSKKIVDCSPKEIIEKLSLIYMLIGLRPQHFPTQQEDILLLTFIKKHFGHKSIDELYFAFELAILGHLEIDDIKVYDQFTIEYLVRIMNCYRKWLLNKSKDMTKKIEYPGVKELTNEDKIDEIKEWQTRQLPNFRLIPLYLYEWMVEFKYINLSVEQKLKLYHNAIELRTSELKNSAENEGNKTEYKNFMKLKNANFDNIPMDEIFRIDDIFKKIAVYEYLKNN